MYKMLKMKIDNLDKIDLEEQKKEIIKIYSILLGYYSASIDKNIFNNNDNKNIIIEIDARIVSLLNLDRSLISGEGTLKDNIINNINLIVSDRSKIKELSIVIVAFFNGYDYVKEIKNIRNKSIFDYVFNKEKNKEDKILNLKKKMDEVYFTEQQTNDCLFSCLKKIYII